MTAEEYDNMSREMQAGAVAKAVGWKHTGEMYLWLTPDGEDVVANTQIPFYPEDLNAMHEAERLLDSEQWARYTAILANDDTKEGGYVNNGAVHAPADRRARAFVIVMGEAAEPKPDAIPMEGEYADSSDMQAHERRQRGIC